MSQILQSFIIHDYAFSNCADTSRQASRDTPLKIQDELEFPPHRQGFTVLSGSIRRNGNAA